jgi:hypothetical protein
VALCPRGLLCLQDCCFVAVGAAFGASFDLWRRPILGLWGVFVLAS